MKRHLHEGPLLTQPTLLEIFSHIRDHRRVVVPAAAEERAVAVDEVHERIRDAIDQRSGQGSSAHTLTRRIDLLISPLPVPNVLEVQ